MLTISQFMILAKGLKETYQRDKFLQTEDSLQIWYEYLKDIEYDQLSMAIHKYIVNNKFAPTIADLRELANTITNNYDDWAKGWADVEMAIRKYGMYNIEAGMESLNGITKDTVERIGFKNLCISENVVSDRAQFRNTYETLEKRKKADNMLPEAIRNNLQRLQLANNTIIESKN